MEELNSGTWVIDPVHSKIRFDIKYLLLTSVTGWFTEVEGRVDSPTNNFDSSQIQLVMYTNSLTTLNDTRDQHLRSEDFFDTANFPKILFQSTSVQGINDHLHVTGNLTVKEVTEQVEFDVKFFGAVKDPYGNRKAGFEMRTRLNRKDFNISWNNYFDQNGILLSDEIDIIADIQLLKVA